MKTSNSDQPNENASLRKVLQVALLQQYLAPIISSQRECSPRGWVEAFVWSAHSLKNSFG